MHQSSRKTLAPPTFRGPHAGFAGRLEFVSASSLVRRFAKLLLTLVLAYPGFAAPTGPTANVPSFPGAEGFGATTPGGRGGRVIEVTTLDDDGPGSLRRA